MRRRKRLKFLKIFRDKKNESATVTTTEAIESEVIVPAEPESVPEEKKARRRKKAANKAQTEE